MTIQPPPVPVPTGIHPELLERMAYGIAQAEYQWLHQSTFAPEDMERLKIHAPDTYSSYIQGAINALQAYSGMWSDVDDTDNELFMQERVARAISANDEEHWLAEDSEYHKDSWDELSEKDRTQYMHNARAALDAMLAYHPRGTRFVIVEIPPDATREQEETIIEAVADAAYDAVPNEERSQGGGWDPFIYGMQHPYGPEGARLFASLPREGSDDDSVG